jgi:hypothetical protein
VDHAFLILVLNDKGLPTLFEGGRMVVAGPAGLNDAARAVMLLAGGVLTLVQPAGADLRSTRPFPYPISA